MQVNRSLSAALLIVIILSVLPSVGCMDFGTVQASEGNDTIGASISSPNSSLANQAITRIQSYQYGAGISMANEPSEQTSITLENAPLQGDVLISVIGVQAMHTTVTDDQGVVTPPSSFEAATVASINETGVVWNRQVRGNSTAYTLDVEIWLGVVVSQANPSITINLDNLPANSVIEALTVDVCEYSGVATNSPLDKTAANTGFGSTANTGLTAPTTQPNELWIGAILFESSGQQTSPTNEFLLLDGQSTATGGRICTAFLERIVNGLGTVNTETTIKYGDETLSGAWVGCIATFSSTPVDTPTQTPAVNPTPTPNSTPIPNATATPTPLPNNGTGQIPFFVESNSTVTKLFFNSTNSELSFTVSGESGTTGYTEITIAKSLVSSIQDVKVYLDGNQLNFAITEKGDSWLLRFTYTHSTHDIVVSLATSQESQPWQSEAILIVAIIVLIVGLVLGLLVIFMKRRKA
jgi:hypothetical protein